MSNTVGLRELRQHPGAVLRRVSRGEAIDVTDHGHPIAQIIPLRLWVIDQLILEGRATPAAGELLDAVEEMGLPRPRRGSRLPSDALADLRSHER